MRNNLDRLVKSGDLLPWEPTLPGEASPRTLFVSRQVDHAMDPSTWHDPTLAVRYAQLSSDFDRFATGDLIQVGMSPYDKGDDAFMARIDPAAYGLWSIRSVAPRPAMRVLGAFCEQDVFVALQVYERATLGGRGSTQWARARENALALWHHLFEGPGPFLGENLNDFISEAAIAV